MMGKQTKPNIHIRNLLDETNQFYEEFLGYSPEQTSLQQIPELKWERFTNSRGLNSNSSGIYLLRNQTAIIRGENPLSLFHEYFGHGLYCEQNLTGIKLVNLEKRLLEEEKQEFSNLRFTLEDLKKFRQENQTFQELEKFRGENLGKYELFAIWSEYLLSGEHNLREAFERKYDSLQKQEKEIIVSLIDFNKKYGNLATMYAQGMARRTTPERVKKLLEDVYKSEAVNNSKLILLTGSKKPFSDIDLFASSNYLRTAKNAWLDLAVFDEEDFERRIKLFEVQITYPIIVGEFVSGDKDYLEQKKNQLNEQPITKEAIEYNFLKSEEQRVFSLNKNFSIKQKKIHESYSKTYLANALALKEGKRLFTKEELLSYSHSENKIELKGGKIDNVRAIN